MTSDIWLSEDDSTNRLKPIQLVQSPSENDNQRNRAVMRARNARQMATLLLLAGGLALGVVQVIVVP